jgi:single-strand DNA-binding protein
MYLNTTTIIGNLTRDVELKALPSGTQVASFSVATNRTWKDKDGKKQEEVEYHNVVSFGKQAEIIAQYFHKGNQIGIIGRLKTRSWDKDGVKQYRTEIVAENFIFGNNPKTDSAPKTTTQQTVDAQYDGVDVPAGEIDPADIPF